MAIPPFKLERFFAEYEFKVKYLLSPSDCESLGLKELLLLADPECQDLWDKLKLGYTESTGHPILRAEIAQLYPGLNPDQILVAVPEEAIFIAMHTLLRPGDHIISIFPAYQSLHEVAHSIGCRVTPWMVHLENQTWHLDLDFLENNITPETRMVVINFPHNPTGYTISSEELDQIVSIARKHNLFLFSDEMYRFLEYSQNDRLPPVCNLYEKGISLSGLSKAFALPGLRIGWLATQDAIALKDLETYKDYTTICSSAPSEILSIIALRAKVPILARNSDIIKTNLQHANAFFQSNQDLFNWIPPTAGPIAFPRWLGNFPVDLFCQQVLDQQGVMILPGSVFDIKANHFRIGLGRRNFSEAMNRVGDYLGQFRAIQ